MFLSVAETLGLKLNFKVYKKDAGALMNSRIRSGVFRDIWEISSSWLYNQLVLATKRNASLDSLHIVTAADSSHGDSLIQLLGSIQIHEPQARVSVVDMGLSHEQLQTIENAFSELHFDISKFPFEKYPSFFDVKIKAGEYAWKPVIIYNTSLETNSRVLLWLDAGDLLKGRLIAERYSVIKHGFWSPKSAGTVHEWTHPGLLSKFGFSRKQLSSRNLNGAIVGFCPADPKGQLLLELWALTAMQKSWIAPYGSSRDNHRQDQALLTVLAIALGKKTQPSRASRILLHQDVENEL